MKFESDRGFIGMRRSREPAISAMTQTALDILQKSDDGFFLMIEGTSHLIIYVLLWRTREQVGERQVPWFARAGHILLGVTYLQS